MVARNRSLHHLGQYCLATTLVATAIAATPAYASCSSPSLFPARDCAVDRSAPAMHGPFEFNLIYSDKVGYIYDSRFSNDLGSSDAISLEFAFGLQNYKGAATWGHAFSDNFFFKFTAEYFRQEPTFYFSSGPEDDWIGQWDFGVDFRYLFLGIRGLDSFHIGFQHLQAQSKALDPVLYNGGLDLNIRHIKGGVEFGGVLGVRIRPWGTAYLDLDLYYDQNEYKTAFSPDNDAIGFGGGFAFHQTIGERFQFILSAIDRRPYYEYMAGAKWIARHSYGSVLEFNAKIAVDGGDVAFTKENVFGIGFSYSWGGDMYAPPVVYRDPLNRGLRQELVDYTSAPATRPPQILAIIDETTI